MNDKVRSYISLSGIKGLGKSLIDELLKKNGSLKDIFEADVSDLVNFGFPLKYALDIVNSDRDFISKELDLLSKLDGKVVTYEDDSYPQLLKEISAPPLFLYLLGNEKCLNSFCISLVGSRKVSSLGQQMSRILAKDLAKVGVTVVSGLAYGVDINSHIACIEENAPTIAVLGSGLNNIYPKNHIKYISGIIQNGGCIISEFSMNEPPMNYNFPIRNRIVAGISRGTVVVEASKKSGSLITSRLALEQGRDVFAVPCHPLSLNNAANFLIQSGAIPALSYEDIIREYSEELKEILTFDSGVSSVAFENPLYALVYDTLSIESMSVDELILKLDSSYNEIISALTVMEIDGYISKGGDFRYSINKV